MTATRLPTPPDAVVSSVTMIRGDDLRARGIRFVQDALREVPGATVVQVGSYGGVSSLFLRGGESDYVKVLVDGVPVNQSGGAYNWANLTTDNVDRIEVLRGPASVLYGSDAVSGVVQIFTRRGQGRPAIEGGAEAGTFGTVIRTRGCPGRKRVAELLRRRQSLHHRRDLRRSTTTTATRCSAARPGNASQPEGTRLCPAATPTIATTFPPISPACWRTATSPTPRRRCR